MTWIYIIIGLLIIGWVIEHFKKVDAKSEDWQRRKDMGIDESNLISMGLYLGGLPGVEPKYRAIEFQPNATGFTVYGKLKQQSPVDAAGTETLELTSISFHEILNLTVEDSTTMERRWSATNIALFGLAGLALQKSKKSGYVSLNISLKNGRLESQAFFAFYGPDNMRDATTARDKIIEHINREDVDKEENEYRR